ncbi:MAG: GntR family transcriptional regulator [Victivallales bacterium]
MQESKHREIALEIRRRILSGKLKPEEQLPNRMELERKFKVSRVTMQKAIDSLVKDGTLYAKGLRGTFVSKSPREIYHYGLVFLHEPDTNFPWSRHLKVVLREAENIFSKTPCSLSVFYGDKYHLNANGNIEFVEDVRNRRMAGLILTMNPALFEGTEVIGDSETPKVTTSPGQNCSIPSISYDSTGIIGEMAKYLAERNCSKTALVMYSRQHQDPGYLDIVAGELERHGLETSDFWALGADISRPLALRNIIQLMMRDKNFRPDSIMILDDNLIPGVIEGLKASNVRVPKDVELVAMVNFPYDEKLDVPVKMFGFDIPGQLRLIKIKLDAIRQNQKYEKATTIKFVSDTEYESKAGFARNPNSKFEYRNSKQTGN